MSVNHAIDSLWAMLEEAGVDRSKIKIEPDPTNNGSYWSFGTPVTAYAYDLTCEGVRLETLIPGIPPDEWKDSLVRCYIDGNSWMWEYAVDWISEWYHEALDLEDVADGGASSS